MDLDLKNDDYFLNDPFRGSYGKQALFSVGRDASARFWRAGWRWLVTEWRHEGLFSSLAPTVGSRHDATPSRVIGHPRNNSDAKNVISFVVEILDTELNHAIRTLVSNHQSWHDR